MIGRREPDDGAPYGVRRTATCTATPFTVRCRSEGTRLIVEFAETESSKPTYLIANRKILNPEAHGRAQKAL